MIQRTGRCKAIVLAGVSVGVLFLLASCTPAPPLTVYSGYVKSTELEQFGVTATEVEMPWGWNQTGYGPEFTESNPFPEWGGYCYVSAFPGWSIDSCDNSTFYDSLSDEVGENVWGHFHNDTCPFIFADQHCNYTLSGQAYDTPNIYEYWCSLIGEVPAIWKGLHCAGNIVVSAVYG